jgi:hypothetical protein
MIYNFKRKFIKKLDSALEIVKNLECMEFKNSRLLTDLTMFINVLKCLNEYDLKEINKQKQKLKPQIEKLLQDCKDFINFYKIYGNIKKIINVLCHYKIFWIN